VNRIATIQEHVMILKTIKSGVSEERIAKVLNVDVGSIRKKRDLLDGICKEAAEILKNRHLSSEAVRRDEEDEADATNRSRRASCGGE
jgi:hypothetical protein